MEPLVSEPMAKPTSPAATADPGPLEEPPLQKFVFHGVSPVPVGTSIRFVVAHAAGKLHHGELGEEHRPRLAQAADHGRLGVEHLLAIGPAPHVVGMPGTATRSFTPYGTPCSGPRMRPARSSRSAVRASSRARSPESVTTALSREPCVESRCRYPSVSSTDVYSTAPQPPAQLAHPEEMCFAWQASSALRGQDAEEGGRFVGVL